MHSGGESRTAELEVKGIHYRPILEVINVALDDLDAPSFHYTPYKEFWKPFDGSCEERVYGELYACDAWLKVHEEVQNKPRDEGVENCILPIILYSDSTHLANFGSASLWPLYMYFGGQSKYSRCKITEPVCHHLAYIPSVSGNMNRYFSSQVLALRRLLIFSFLLRFKMFTALNTAGLHQPTSSRISSAN